MNRDNLSNVNASWTDGASMDLDAKRLADVGRVPFLIRRWWLREFEEASDCVWQSDFIASALWSNYSDPLCDFGGLEDFDDF